MHVGVPRTLRRGPATMSSRLTAITFSLRRFLGTWRDTRVRPRITYQRVIAGKKNKNFTWCQQRYHVLALSLLRENQKRWWTTWDARQHSTLKDVSKISRVSRVPSRCLLMFNILRCLHLRMCSDIFDIKKGLSVKVETSIGGVLVIIDHFCVDYKSQ